MIYVYGQEDEPIVLDKFSPSCIWCNRPRRGASFCGDFPSHAAQCQPIAQ